MSTELSGVLTVTSRVHVGAMAEIVRELVAGGAARAHTSSWLAARTTAAALSPAETSALEALRLRLCACGATMLDAVTALTW